ncbi:MAG: hypothetical protein Q4Q07_08855 [Tissierellia bacterium]|nr:hypothetical protein [Tissierellia bacterium]
MVEDLLNVYRNAGKNTVKSLKAAPGLILLPLGLGLLYFLVMNFVGPFVLRGGLLSGILLALIEALLLTLAYSLYQEAIVYKRMPRNISISQDNFWSVYSVLFIFMLINLVTAMTGPLKLFIPLLLTIILNPIPEAIYLRGERYTGAFEFSLRFMKENSLHFILPFLIYIGILSFITPIGVAMLHLGSNIMELPFGIPFQAKTGDFSALGIYVICQLITGVYLIFRGQLFLILENSSRRKRKYMEEWK